MTKSILVTGTNGQLGQSIKRLADDYENFDFTFVKREELDLSELSSFDSYFQDKSFDVIINCAAHTAVDKAEEESELADVVNHLAVERLAEICKTRNTFLIHVSTDYVFNGRNFKPYVETDITDPQSVYGRTKLAGEKALQAINPNGIIIRTSWVYSEVGNNFVKTMLRLGKERDSLNVIFDQIGSPTYAGDLAKAILEIISTCAIDEQPVKSNIYHFSNEGSASWYDFARAIFEISNTRCEVFPIETKDYPTPAKRPHYSLLNKTKIKQGFGISIPYWKDSLKTCLTAIKFIND